MAVTTVETGLAKDESAHGAAAQSYPTHALDNTYIKTCTIFLGLVISGRLSPELLKDAALTLISQWPELGGYIDSSTTPATIHPDATGGSFDFKARRLEGKTLASTALPCPNEKSTTEKPEAPQFYPIDAKEAEPLFHFESMDSMGRVPKNIFALRATVLDDATLLGFRLPHMFSDGEGTCEVVKAFATVLSEGQLPKLTKRPSTISLALNLRPATNGSTGKQAQAQVKVQEYADKVGASKQSWMDFRLGVMGFLNYITRGLICGISESMVKNNKPQHMLVKLPGPFVASLKAKAIEDLTSADGKTSADISTNDAISAYLLQVINP